MHLRESLTGSVLAGLALLMLGASQFAPLIPVWETLPEIPGESHLDYGPSPPGLFAPLTDEFIARALGIERARATADAVEPGPGSRPASTRHGASSAPAPPGIVVTHPLTNDDIEDAYVVERIPFTARTSSAGAGRQQGEPGSCTPAGATIWYRYRPTADGGLIANTIGTERPTSLGVFVGGPGNMHQLRCAEKLDGNSRTAFPVKTGSTYFFQVTTPTPGPVVFNLDPLGTTERVSVSSGDQEANGVSQGQAMSDNGRWIVFRSVADNLVDGDTNDVSDVFVHDRYTRETTRVSVNSRGEEGNRHSSLFKGSITPGGRYVAFHSWADNLVDEDGDGDYDDDTNGWHDVFVHDRWTGETTRVSVDSSGAQGQAPISPWVQCRDRNDCNYGSSMSADGRYVAFESSLVDLVPGDNDLLGAIPPAEGVPAQATIDVFVHDTRTGETTMVSVHSDGEYANDFSDDPYLSADGRYVAFRSRADNLVDGDTNNADDVFVHDRRTGRTTRVSVSSDGEPADLRSYTPVISRDGRFVAFSSEASNLVPDDDNNGIDAFVHDRWRGETTRVSVTSNGEEQDAREGGCCAAGDGAAWVAQSGDGRFVAFSSTAKNLDPGEGDAAPNTWSGSNIFVHDRLRGTTINATITSHGTSAVRVASHPLISADGRVVSFTSPGRGFVEKDHNGDGVCVVHELPSCLFLPSPRTNWWITNGFDVFAHTFPVLR